jgi:hypothetical protein
VNVSFLSACDSLFSKSFISYFSFFGFDAAAAYVFVRFTTITAGGVVGI